MSERILITGAAGFIGSHLADALNDNPYVWLVDNFTTGRPENLLFHQFQHVDIANRQEFYRVANEAEPTLIIHCAASYSDPNLWHRDTDTNVTGSINVALAAKHHGARVVYFQTALPPISSYAISKHAGQRYLELSGVPLTVFRLANIYGPRNLSGPIPTFYKRLMAGEPCTVVDTRRDLVYIDDLVDMVVAHIASEWHFPSRCYDVYTGHGHTIREIYDAVAGALGIDAEPQEIPRGTDDVAEMKFGFGYPIEEPTPLKNGVRDAVAWYREHGVDNTYTHLKMEATSGERAHRTAT